MAALTVGQVFGRGFFAANSGEHPLVHGSRHVGVEIELEGVREAPGLRHWTITGDGSLRDGLEFVFNEPKNGVHVFEAMTELDNQLARMGLRMSWRCSAHVHINVVDMVASQIKLIALGWLFFEKLMFRMSGMHRYRNNFCPAFGFAQTQLTALAHIWHLEDQHFLRELSEITAKYSSLNFRPMAQFGSIEFRISEPKAQSGQLLRLVNRFLGIVEYAANFKGTEREFIEHLMNIDVEDVFPKGLPTNYRVGDDLAVGGKLAQDLLAMVEYRRRMRENPDEAPQEAPVREPFPWEMGGAVGRARVDVAPAPEAEVFVDDIQDEQPDFVIHDHNIEFDMGNERQQQAFPNADVRAAVMQAWIDIARANGLRPPEE